VLQSVQTQSTLQSSRILRQLLQGICGSGRLTPSGGCANKSVADKMAPPINDDESANSSNSDASDTDDKYDAFIVNRPPLHDRYVSIWESRISEVKGFFHDEQDTNQQAPYKKLSMNTAKLWMPPNTIIGSGNFQILPEWLSDWTVVRCCQNNTRTTIITDAVTQLLGETFDNTEDREDITRCLEVSDTITLGRFSTSNDNEHDPLIENSTNQSKKVKDSFEAYATILFIQHEKSAFVVYVAIHPALRDMGFGTFLFVLLIKYLLSHGFKIPKIVRSQAPSDPLVGGVSILLHVNEALNPVAVKFYENRGFEQVKLRQVQAKVLPKGLLKKLKTSPFNFVWPKKLSEPGMAWFFLRAEKLLKVSSSVHKSITLGPPVNPFIRANLLGVFEDLSIYAQLPGNLNLVDAEHCGDGFLLLEGGCNGFKTTDKAQLAKPMTSQLHHYKAFLPWCERLRICAGKPFMGATHRATSIALAWLSRNPSLPLWKERITAVPPCVGGDLAKAYPFFQRYVLRTDMLASGESTEKADSIFHHRYDERRFTECMRNILQYILYHPELMTNQLTALFIPGDHIHHPTSCVVAINPGKFNDDDTNPISLDNPVCGFLHFNPSVSDREFSLLPIDKDNPFLFFLGIASFIWKPDSALIQPLLTPIQEYVANCKNDEDYTNNAVFDGLVSTFCDQVCSSSERLDKAIFEKVYTFYNAGRAFRVSADETQAFSGNPNFIQFALPATYPLRCTMEEIAWSDVYCLMFFIDVCTSLVDKDFTWKRSGGIKPVVISQTYNKMAQTNYSIPLMFEFGRVWKTRIVLSSRKKRRKNDIYVTYQEKFSKASFVAVQQVFYEIICLIDRLHSKLELKDCNELEMDEDYRKYLKCTIDKDIEKPLANRFGHGTLVPDIAITAFGAKSWDPKKRTKADNESSTSLVPAVPDASNPLDIMADAISVAEKRTAVALTKKPNTAGYSSSSSSTSSYASHQSDKAFSFNSMLMSPIGKLKDPQPSNLKKRKPVEASAKEVNKKLQAKTKRMRRSPKEIPSGDFIACQCAAAMQCAKPGMSALVSRQDIVQCYAIRCNECNEWAHTICLQYRKKLLLCPTCYAKKKTEDHTKQLMAPKRTPRDFVVIVPDSFNVPEINQRDDEDDRRQSASEAIDNMQRILDEEMVHRGFLSANDMEVWMKQCEGTIENNKTSWDGLTKQEQRKAMQIQNEYWNLSRTWKKVHKALKRSYLATTPSLVKAIRYDTKKREFFTLVEWQDDIGQQNSIRTATLPVNDEAWVRDMFEGDFVEYVKRCAQLSEGDRYLPVPCRVSVNIDARVITHIRCCRGLNLDGSYRFRCQYATGKGEEDISEAYLRDNFPKAYIDAVIDYRMRPGGQGFINVPAGDVVHRDGLVIPMQNELGLKHTIKFKQNQQDTCVYSSFASALWCIGMHDLATTLAGRCTEKLHSPRILQHLAHDMNGHWLQSVKIKNAGTMFNLLDEDLEHTIAVVVIRASDGQCSHAITVHDGLVFDSNEDFAIPLTQANLDYICSTNEQEAAFVGVASGYLFREQGKRNRLRSIKSSVPGSPWTKEHKDPPPAPAEQG